MEEGVAFMANLKPIIAHKYSINIGNDDLKMSRSALRKSIFS